MSLSQAKRKATEIQKKRHIKKFGRNRTELLKSAAYRRIKAAYDKDWERMQQDDSKGGPQTGTKTGPQTGTKTGPQTGTKTGPHIVPAGAECLDLLMYTDVDLREYLEEDPNNFVIKIENKYIGQNIDNLRTEYKHDIVAPYLIRKGSKKYKEFFECKNADMKYLEESGNVIFDKTYIKMSVPGGTFIEKPNWLWNGPLPAGSRVFKLVDGPKINAAVSNEIYHAHFNQIGNLTGMDHCNHLSPVKTYKIDSTQMTLA